MILIFSESNDITTSQTIEWLLYESSKNEKVLRLNECDKLLNISIWNEKIILEFYLLATNTTIKLNLDEVEMVWYRKGGFNIKYWLEEKKLNSKILDKFIASEIKVLINYIYYTLGAKKNLASIFNSSMNKLYVNTLAKQIGLKTPEFIISTEIESLEKFIESQNDNCITKAISETFCVPDHEQIVISYTELVKKDDLKIYESNVKPTLLQKCIEKKYELRIFYLDGICYCSAIFSQRDAQTKVDFRKYNYIKPNRTVPFNLPEDIAEKIDQLMKKVNLKTGSIDMLVSTNNEYIFLEINPVGQFGMVSAPCNYYLEKKVATYLAN
jgi:ATP-GRASP peptide maturase of grasp-with-spasm system